MNRFQKKLNDLQTQQRLRSLKKAQGIDLTSNDYLGFRNHPALRQAAIEALESGMPMGSGGSRLLRGHNEHHEKLETFAAQYFGAEKALYFSSGFQANHAIFSTLPDRRDTIIFDELIHASAREGIQASAAKHIRVRHNDLNAYEDALKKARAESDMIWMAVESVYSMEGDRAPLKELYDLARTYDAVLIVDEAHATGIFGKNGKGGCEDFPQEGLITLHTCGKALGIAGGLICGAQEIIDTLVNRAKGFIYTTAPIPLQSVLVQRALQLVQEEPWRREKLLVLRDAANGLLPVEKSGSQIIPIILGDDARAMQVAAEMQRAGFDVRAIRPPTVPEGTARLRISLNCNLDEKTLQDFAGVLMSHLQKRAA